MIYIYLIHLFDWVLKTSIMASILVGLIFCVKILLRNKLTPKWHYLLWMILIVRLILPWSLESSFSIYSILSYGYKTTVSVQSHPVVSTENKSIQEETNLSSANIVTKEERSNASSLQTTNEGNKEGIPYVKQKDEPISFYTIALYIWLTGVIVLGFIIYLVNRRLYHYIQQQPVITDKRIVKIFENCKKSMSVRQGISLLLVGKISSPTVFGFFHPRVLLSSAYINRLTEQQLRHIFYHELAHVKRRDVGLNWLMHSLLILNWFNPILWYAYICMREDQELACDAYALTFMEEKEKISYGHTIISLLEHYSNYYQVPSLANFSRNKRTLKRRIFMIKNFHKKSYRWPTLGVIVVIAIASLSLLNAHADGVKEKQKEQTTNKTSTIEAKKEETVYIPQKQAENYKDMTKEEILTKMINSVDYFETAKGEFKMHYANLQGDTLVDYELSLNNNAGGYSKITNMNNGKERVTYQYYKDSTMWMINEETGTYSEAKYQDNKSHSEGTLKIENAFSVENDGVNVTKYRQRPPIGQAMSSLFPYEIASNYTRDLNTWEIEKQNEELLGHNTLVIKGNVNKRNFQSFRFWVDKDTGILVKYETYNSAGEVVDYLHPTKLEINVPIDSKRFTPNLDGYTNMKTNQMEQPRMATGNIDKLIPEDLKVQWEEAKKKTNETTILHQNDKWYISAKKGYLVNKIEVNGKEGTLFLVKATDQKSQFTFHALAEGYKIDNLKVAE